MKKIKNFENFVSFGREGFLPFFFFVLKKKMTKIIRRKRSVGYAIGLPESIAKNMEKIDVVLNEETHFEGYYLLLKVVSTNPTRIPIKFKFTYKPNHRQLRLEVNQNLVCLNLIIFCESCKEAKISACLYKDNEIISKVVNSFKMRSEKHENQEIVQIKLPEATKVTRNLQKAQIS